MSDQPEALRLADEIDTEELSMDRVEKWVEEAAAELRRQHDEIEQLKAERDALLAVLKEAVECDGGDDGLFHACCGESFWTAHDVKCWVPKARAAIDAARSEKNG